MSDDRTKHAWFRKLSGPPRSRTLSWRHGERLSSLTAGAAEFYLGDEAGQLLAWHPGEPAARLLYRAGRGAALVRLAASGEHVACAWDDGQVGVWHLARQTLLPLDGPGEPLDLAALLALPEGWFAWVYRAGPVWLSRGAACDPSPLLLGQPIRTAVFAPHSGDLVLALDDGSVVFWGPGGGAGRSVHLPHPAVLLAAGPGRQALALDEQGSLFYITPHAASLLPADSSVTAVAILDDGRLATGHRVRWTDPDGTAADVVVQGAGAEKRRLSSHTDTVLALVGLAAGRLASAGADGVVHVWDLQRNRVRSVARHDEAVTTLAVLRSGRELASLAGQAVKVWVPAAAPEMRARLRRALEQPWTVVAEGRVVLVEGTLQIVDDDGRALKRCSVAIHATAAGGAAEAGMHRLGASAAGVCWLSHDGSVVLWDVEQQRVHEAGRIDGFEQVGVVVPIDRRQVATGHDDGRICLHHLAEQPPRTRELSAVGDDPVTALAAGGSGCLLAGWRSGRVCLWTDTGQGSLALPLHGAAVTALAVLPDGRVASAAGDGALWLRQPGAEDPALVYTTEEPIVALAFDAARWVLVCGLESGAVLRLGIEPEFSRCQARALAGADTVVLAAGQDTTIVRPGDDKKPGTW
jgi:WD40 repeat protein